MFFTFSKLYKWYQITQSIKNVYYIYHSLFKKTRSSHLQVFCWLAVLQNFAKTHRKTVVMKTFFLYSLVPNCKEVLNSIFGQISRPISFYHAWFLLRFDLKRPPTPLRIWQISSTRLCYYNPTSQLCTGAQEGSIHAYGYHFSKTRLSLEVFSCKRLFHRTLPSYCFWASKCMFKFCSKSKRLVH